MTASQIITRFIATLLTALAFTGNALAAEYQSTDWGDSHKSSAPACVGCEPLSAEEDWVQRQAYTDSTVCKNAKSCWSEHGKTRIAAYAYKGSLNNTFLAVMSNSGETWMTLNMRTVFFAKLMNPEGDASWIRGACHRIKGETPAQGLIDYVLPGNVMITLSGFTVICVPN